MELQVYFEATLDLKDHNIYKQANIDKFIHEKVKEEMLNKNYMSHFYREINEIIERSPVFQSRFNINPLMSYSAGGAADGKHGRKESIGYHFHVIGLARVLHIPTGLILHQAKITQLTGDRPGNKHAQILGLAENNIRVVQHQSRQKRKPHFQHAMEQITAIQAALQVDDVVPLIVVNVAYPPGKSTIVASTVPLVAMKPRISIVELTKDQDSEVQSRGQMNLALLKEQYATALDRLKPLAKSNKKQYNFFADLFNLKPSKAGGKISGKSQSISGFDASVKPGVRIRFEAREPEDPSQVETVWVTTEEPTHYMSITEALTYLYEAKLLTIHNFTGFVLMSDDQIKKLEFVWSNYRESMKALAA